MTVAGVAKPSRILLAHNERVARETLARDLAGQGYEVRATASFDTLWKWVRAGEGDLILIDVDITDPARNGFELLQQIRKAYPSLPALVLSAENTVLTSLLAARFDAFDFFPKPFSFEQLTASMKRALRTLEPEEINRKAQVNLPLVGRSAPMQAVYRQIAQVAQSNLPLLVTGETGTGKSLVARVIHDYGNNPGAGFAVLHFPLSDDQFETCITNATTQAGEGTLVLDEISAVTTSQHDRLISLLSVMTTQECAPRLITTTRTPYSEARGLNGIDHELLYRLNTLHITLPPLRNRSDDCLELAQTFLSELGKGRKSLSKQASQALQSRGWPGNVRELRNLMQRALVMARSDVIEYEDISDLPEETGKNENSLDKAFEQALIVFLNERDSETKNKNLHAQALAAVERPLLKQVMAMTNGNQLKAARQLGINRNTLHTKLLRYGLLSQ